jgi:DeoR/GlpR family transcriptional regulator of sugar metabolism
VLAAQRRELLLARLHADGRLVAKDLADELGLSEDSLRRDLRELAAAGLCQRVYGGALPSAVAAADYSVRGGIAVESKARVARRAVALIQPGMTVLIDGGTTALAVARALPVELRATVVTHSVTVAAALLTHTALDVIVLGGRLFKHSAVTTGAAAAEAAGSISADLFLLGVTGVHEQAGITTADPDEAAMKRLLAHRAAETYVLASSEKIGAVSPFAVVPLSDVAGIVTDAPTKNPTIKALRAAAVAILRAG